MYKAFTELLGISNVARIYPLRYQHKGGYRFQWMKWYGNSLNKFLTGLHSSCYQQLKLRVSDSRYESFRFNSWSSRLFSWFANKSELKDTIWIYIRFDRSTYVFQSTAVHNKQDGRLSFQKYKSNMSALIKPRNKRTQWNKTALFFYDSFRDVETRSHSTLITT